MLHQEQILSFKSRSHFERVALSNGYTFRGTNSFIFILVSYLIRGRVLKERICPTWSKFSPLRVDPILKGLHCRMGTLSGEQTPSFSFLSLISLGVES